MEGVLNGGLFNEDDEELEMANISKSVKFGTSSLPPSVLMVSFAGVSSSSSSMMKSFWALLITPRSMTASGTLELYEYRVSSVINSLGDPNTPDRGMVGLSGDDGIDFDANGGAGCGRGCWKLARSKSPEIAAERLCR